MVVQRRLSGPVPRAARDLHHLFVAHAAAHLG